MTITAVHLDSGESAFQAATITSGSWTSTTGSTIIVVAHYINGTGAIVGGDCTDSKSNTYSAGPGVMGGTNACGIALYYNIGGTRGSTHTVTVNPVNSGGNSINIAVLEITATGTITYNSAAGATANDTTSPFTVTAAADVGTGAIGIYGCVIDTGGTNAWTNPTGYTDIFEQANGAAAMVSHASYKIGETGTPAPAASNADTVDAGSARQIFAAFNDSDTGSATAPVVTLTSTTALAAFTITATRTNPYLITSAGAAITTSRSPSVTFSGYTPVLNDLVVLYPSSTTTGHTMTEPATWVNPLGAGVDVESDSHQIACAYHFVTAGEVSGVTTTYTATNWYGATHTGYVHGLVIRNVDTVTPVDSANSAFNSGNTTTPHVLAGLTGTNLSNNSFVTSSVAKDATGDYGTSAPGSWTWIINSNTNQGKWTGNLTALTTANSDVTATNITPSAGDEYASITVAWTKAVGDVTAPVATVTSLTGLPTFTIQASQTAPLTTISSATELPAFTISTGTTATAPVATVTSGTLLPAFTIQASQTALLATLTVTLTLPTITIQASQTAPLATLTVTTGLPTMLISTGTNATALLTVISSTTRLPPMTTKPFAKSISGRRLLDSFGNDFIFKNWSSWGLAQNLGNSDITTHLEGVAARAFNSVMVMLFGYNVAGDWDPYVAGNGSAVFTGTPYQSSLGAGWTSMDWVVSESHRLGLTVIFSLYTAYGATGPRADMEAASNGQMTTFGSSVAARYIDYDNIVWHIGSDDQWLTIHTIADRVDAFFQGVNAAEGSTRRPIRLIEPNNGNSGFTQYPSWYGAGNVDLTVNSEYDYTDDAVVNADAVHNESGATTIPWWDCEPPYRWAAHYGDVATIEPQEIRERIYSDIIRGAVGVNVGNEDSWPFGKTGLFTGGRTWQQTLTDDDAFWAEYAWDIFDDSVGNTAGYTRDSGAFITSGIGSTDTKAASAYSGDKGVVYTPTSRAMTADLSVFSGTWPLVKIRKYDVTTGTFTTIGTFASSITNQSISAPGNNASSTFSDWVFLFEGEPVTTAPLATLTSTTGLPTITIQASQTAPLATLTSGTLLPAMTILATTNVPLATLTSATELPAFTVTGAATAPLGLTVTLTLPTFTIQSSQTAPLATLTVLTELPAVTIHASQTAPLLTLTVTTVLPAFTIQASQTAPLGTLSSPTELPPFAIQAGGTATAPLATITVLTGLPAMTISVSSNATVSLATLTITTGLPLIAASTSALAQTGTLLSPTELPTMTIVAGSGATAPVGTLTSTVELPTITISVAGNITASLPTLTVTTDLPTVGISAQANVSFSVSALTINVELPTFTILLQATQATVTPFDDVVLVIIGGHRNRDARRSTIRPEGSSIDQRYLVTLNTQESVLSAPGEATTVIAGQQP